MKGLPLHKVRAYRFKQRIGRSKRIGYVIAENLWDARKLIKKKGIRLVTRLEFHKSLFIVSDEKKVAPKLASERWIEKGP